MKPMPGLTIESGIDKSIVDGPIWVSKTGIDGDEHDMTFHGGPTKAVHACRQPFSSLPDPPPHTSHKSLVRFFLTFIRLQRPLHLLANISPLHRPTLHSRRLRR